MVSSLRFTPEQSSIVDALYGTMPNTELASWLGCTTDQLRYHASYLRKKGLRLLKGRSGRGAWRTPDPTPPVPLSELVAPAPPPSSTRRGSGVPWTAEELAFLKEHWGALPDHEVSKRLSRSIEGCRIKAS